MENIEKTKGFIAELSKVYAEIDSLGEVEKAIKTRIKESGGDPAVISAVAKAAVSAKVDKLLAKSELTTETINLYRE